jgi:hypothetical protein
MLCRIVIEKAEEIPSALDSIDVSDCISDLARHSARAENN